jgi:AcrR family transcriptional regulator
MSKPRRSTRDRGPIWARPAPGTRKPRLTREQIAEVALAIADHEGFEAVSMRRIAEELGAGTMTLYHYIRTKDDLYALMDDALMAEALVPAHELPAGWRDGLAAIARRFRDVFVKHPWAVHGPQGTRLGPHGIRHIEQSMAAVATAPLPIAEKVALCGVLDDFVFGYVLRTVESPGEAVADGRAMNVLVSAQLATGELPHLAAFIGDDKPSVAFERAASWMGDEARFEFGLQALLDAVGGPHRLVGGAGEAKAAKPMPKRKPMPSPKPKPKPHR